MPPVAPVAFKSPSSPLANCVIALSGTFPGQTQTSLEEDFINPLAATLSKSVSASTTHLVTTEVDYAKPSAKVKQAQTCDLPIVSLAWLEDCLSKDARLSEDAYMLGAVNDSASNKSKRTASNDAQSQPQPKKTKTAAASTRRSTPALPSQPSQSGSANGAASQFQPAKMITKKIKDEVVPASGGATNIAKSKDIQIPVDEGCRLNNYRVYIDTNGLIYDASLNQTNSGENNNKFYRVQLLGNGGGHYQTFCRWGRVGNQGQSSTLGNGTLDDALRNFNAKFKDKSGLTWENRDEKPKPKKYTFIERSYEADDDDDDNVAAADVKREKSTSPESKLDPAVQDLMALIFNQQYFAAAMAELNYDTAKLPLGKLAKSTITKGYQALKDLSELLDDVTLAQSEYGLNFDEAVMHCSNQYYSYIPHAFGVRRAPVINSAMMLKLEIDLMDSLSDMKDANNIMKNEIDVGTINALDNQFKGLNLDEMTPLKKESTEFNELKDYLVNTRGATHNANYQVAQIFRIDRQGEKERFKKSPYGGPPCDRRLLWHGSRATNFGGILSQGLRIAPPEAPVSGYMFGKGIYLADMSSKSANYCCAGISNGHALLLLCEAELGDPMLTLTNASYSASEDAKAKGMSSTWGQGLMGPSKWKDAACAHPSLAGVKMPDTSVLPGMTGVQNACLQYNEFITYDVAQVRLRYLFRVKM